MSLTSHRTQHAASLQPKLPKTQIRNPQKSKTTQPLTIGTQRAASFNHQVEKKHNHLSLTSHRTQHAASLQPKLPKTQIRNPQKSKTTQPLTIGTQRAASFNHQVEKKHNHLSLTSHRTQHAASLQPKLPKTQNNNPL